MASAPENLHVEHAQPENPFRHYGGERECLHHAGSRAQTKLSVGEPRQFIAQRNDRAQLVFGFPVSDSCEPQQIEASILSSIIIFTRGLNAEYTNGFHGHFPTRPLLDDGWTTR